MALEIQDGAGTGYRLQVDKGSRLKSTAIVETRGQDATNRQDGFTVNSGLVSLVDATEQGVLFLRNDDARDLHIDSIHLSLGPSTGGLATDITRVKVIKNPTTGTLISSELAAGSLSNRNFGSSLALSATAYKGDGSATVTNGAVHIDGLASPGESRSILMDFLLAKGDSVAITLEANDSNTSMKCMASIVCHLDDPLG